MGFRHTDQEQPPKRKANATAQPAKATAKRRSKLAKEHDVSPDDEIMIQQVWATFCQDHEGDKVIPTRDVRRCLVALNAPPKDNNELKEFVEIVDPDGTGWVEYEQFFGIAALKLNARDDDPDAVNEEVNKAYHLFTRGQDREITINDLKRVAIEMKEDIPDSVLKDMIREAKGGELGTVDLEAFEGVMRRAGVFG